MLLRELENIFAVLFEKDVH